MKIRISHFISKNIAINKTTRPTPRSVTILNNLKYESEKPQACLKRLADKVGFKLETVRRQQGSVKHRTNP